MYSRPIAASWIALSIATAVHAQTPLGTGFTYQGQLKQSGSPANGSFNMDFKLWNDPTLSAPANQVGVSISLGSVPVTNGLFTVSLDFPGGVLQASSVFDGNKRWLEITVNGTTLSPRQELTAAPYSHFSKAGSATQLQTRAVSSAAPVVGQALKWDGAQWGPAAGSNTTYAAGAGLSLSGNVFSIANSGVTNSMVASDAASLNKVSGGAMSTNSTFGTFVGIGTSATIGSAAFVVSQIATGFGGMYVNTSSATGWPFYGYAQGGSIAAYHYVDGADANKWKLYNNGVRLTVTSTGDVGIGTTSPRSSGGGSAKLDVRAGNNSDGIYAQVNGASGLLHFANEKAAVWGDSDIGHGVLGTSSGSLSAGVYGWSSDFNSNGVLGVNFTGGGAGVHGEASAGGYGVYSSGPFAATGTKSFQIDHPLDPENKYLSHYCAEGPEPYNVYKGHVTTDAKGFAWIDLPAYFEEINRDIDYQLTVIDDSDDFILAKVTREVLNHRFQIRTSKPAVKVCWEVKAVRNDRFVKTYGAPVEQDKPKEHRGKYLQPELYGKSKEKGQFYRPEH